MIDLEKSIYDCLDTAIRNLWNNEKGNYLLICGYNAIVESYERFGYDLTLYKITGEEMLRKYGEECSNEK